MGCHSSSMEDKYINDNINLVPIGIINREGIRTCKKLLRLYFNYMLDSDYNWKKTLSQFKTDDQFIVEKIHNTVIRPDKWIKNSILNDYSI